MSGALFAVVTTLVHDDPWGHHGWAGDGWWFPGLIMLIFWITLIGLAVWALARHASPSVSPSHGPREILANRYARGEITTDEYQERLKTLEGSS